jgi:hypothetical protein
MAQSTGRKLRDHQEAAKLIAEWERSGERLSDWCEARGISWHSMSAYKSNGERATPAFVELALDTTPPVDAVAMVSDRIDSRYHIFLGDDVGIEVDDHFRDDTLRRLLRVVASC